MISTKMSKEETKEYAADTADSEDVPVYGYGTQICLESELLKALGFDVPPTAGTEMLLKAKVMVISTEVKQMQDGDNEGQCRLQITEMELSGGGKDAATVLYGS